MRESATFSSGREDDPHSRRDRIDGWDGHQLHFWRRGVRLCSQLTTSLSASIAPHNAPRGAIEKFRLSESPIVWRPIGPGSLQKQLVHALGDFVVCRVGTLRRFAIARHSQLYEEGAFLGALDLSGPLNPLRTSPKHRELSDEARPPIIVHDGVGHSRPVLAPSCNAPMKITRGPTVREGLRCALRVVSTKTTAGLTRKLRAGDSDAVSRIRNLVLVFLPVGGIVTPAM